MKTKLSPGSKFRNKNQTKGAGISESHVPTLFNLAEHDKNKVKVRFSLKETSNYGGLLLLREVENQVGIIDRLTNCIFDTATRGL